MTDHGPTPPCRGCAEGWEHCHDTLVVHRTTAVECSEAGCVLAAEQHEHVLDCADLLGGCGCG